MMGAHLPLLGGNSMKRSIAAAVAAAIGLVLLAAPSALAQGTITAVGKVVDAEGNPMSDVKVLLDYKGHIVQKYRTKTDKNGVFTHVMVYSGPYRITLTKDGVGEVSFNTNLQEVDSLQKPPEYKFVPKAAVAAPPPPGSGLAPAAAPAAAPVDLGQVTSEINNAIALSKNGDTDGAIAAYEAILAKTPEIPLVHHNLGTLYKKKGDAARAQAEMEKAIALDPRFVDGYVGLATLLAETGKRAEAIAAIQKGTTENPQSGRLQYALGVLAEGSGETALAKGAFLKAEQLDPQNFETQYHLATVALNQNDKAEAVSRLEKFIAAAPPDTPSLGVAKSLLAALQKK
jgi:cytochrome c-type biogenesis protein CcmH/NrfG